MFRWSAFPIAEYFPMNIYDIMVQERILLCRILRLRRIALAIYFLSAAVRSRPEGFFILQENAEHFSVI